MFIKDRELKGLHCMVNYNGRKRSGSFEVRRIENSTVGAWYENI